MSVGVYSGGTPNLAAIKTGLDIPNAQYLAFHSLDAVVGSLYFLFMLSLGVPLFRALLPGRPGRFPVRVTFSLSSASAYQGAISAASIGQSSRFAPCTSP